MPDDETYFTVKRAVLGLFSIALALVAASCGGGGSSAAGTTYSSVAMAGELIDYTIDTTALTYSYTITESQFGLTGTTGSGTLVRNGDGSYSPSGVPNARVVVLPNGLLLSAVRERFGSAAVTVPIIGLSNPVTTVDAIAGNYNYIHRNCLLSVCGADHGTFQIAAGGTWTSCAGDDIADGMCSGTSASGTLEPLGNGRWRVMDGSTNIGTALGFASAGQNVILLDLKDVRPGGFGVGMLVGGQQVTMTTAQTDGTWIAGTSAGHWGVFTASGSTITLNLLDGVPVSIPTTFTANAPWTGMATTGAGGVGFLAGAGVYVLETASGGAELGIKLR
ncbi:MAG: hypothetical protein OEU94_11905 [Aquincola sp.]|nr:hypothetical protein [Aquincola sp.]